MPARDAVPTPASLVDAAPSERRPWAPPSLLELDLADETLVSPCQTTNAADYKGFGVEYGPGPCTASV